MIAIREKETNEEEVLMQMSAFKHKKTDRQRYLSTKTFA